MSSEEALVDRIYATEEEIAAAEETEKHWVHWAKVIFIVGKIGILILMMAIAVKVWYAKYRRCTLIPVIMVCFIVVLTLLIVLDMTNKYIAGFFLMIYLSNYFNFLGFSRILKSLPGQPGKTLRRKSKPYFYVMHSLYALTLALAFFPRFGPFCTSEKLYPPVMNWTAFLFIINFFFHIIINCAKDFFLDEGTILKEGQTADDFVAAADANQDERASAHTSKASLDWTSQEKADELSKKMFRKQMTIYLLFQAVLVFCNVAIQLWGRIFVHNSEFLGCTDGGWQWIYTTITGELFVGTHMMLIITQGVMLEQALYKVPLKMGWFKKSEEELIQSDDFPEVKKGETEQGDDFKPANEIN